MKWSISLTGLYCCCVPGVSGRPWPNPVGTFLSFWFWEAEDPPYVGLWRSGIGHGSPCIADGLRQTPLHPRSLPLYPGAWTRGRRNWTQTQLPLSPSYASSTDSQNSGLLGGSALPSEAVSPFSTSSSTHLPWLHPPGWTPVPVLPSS